jgi:predicted N-acyltransferase
MTKPYPSPYSISWIQQLSEIDRNVWDTLAKPLSTPFLEWDWLRLMEISGSATIKTGWLPHHLTVWYGENLVGVAPMYIKGHSAGEFVFDHVWADVAERMGIKYYPKLVGMSPFTPMSGYRFLIADSENELELTAFMVAEIDRLCHRYNISGSSFLFVDPQWHRDMLDHGFCAWRHQSFAWQNEGYENFDEYLTMFNSNQRRNIKRERKALEKQGVFVESFTGKDIPRNFFYLMYSYYERTNEKFGPWGCKYLTNSFFEGLFHHYRNRLLFVAAFEKSDPSSPIGLSLLVTKGDQLYGRYWGCSRPVNSLHFNACYYTPIEWAITNGIHRFDPGAGGAHKIRRGFTAISNHSLHRFYDPALVRIMQAHIDEINRLEQDQIDALNHELPFAQHLKN